jgi:hypothetical protein
VATFAGEPESCSSSCVLELVEICQGSDGCCPESCDPGDDADCSASCGDGVVDTEAGETCEADTDAPCSVSCDDGDACTQDISEGSAKNCNTACTHLPVVKPMSGDGCCPDGAHSLEDADCPAVCGNLVPEQGESCDPCPEICADTDPCTLDELQGSALMCSAVCIHTVITAPAAGDGCCPTGADFTSDSDCSPSCGNGVVEPGEDCDGGSLCRSSCTWRFHPSLIHRYTFDGPASGTDARRALDSIGSAEGSISGDALDGDGKLTLAGGTGGGFVDLPDRLLSVLTDVSVEAWVSWRGGARNQAIFDFGMNSAGEGSSSGDGTSFFFVSPSGLDGKLDGCLNTTPTAGDIDRSQRIDASSALPADMTWQVVLTFQDPGAGAPKTMKLYRNGSRVAGGNDNIPSQTAGYANRLANVDDRNVWIGRANYPVNRFEGTLYEFRIYSQALTEAEVAESFANGPDPSP